MIRATSTSGSSRTVVFRNNFTEVEIDGAVHRVDILQNDRHLHLLVGSRSWNVEVLHINRETKTVGLMVNGSEMEIVLREPIDELLASLGMEGSVVAGQREVKAPMPGLVLQVLVTEGQQVLRDEPLIILEAMKMENVIKSPADGIIRRVGARQGNAVEKNAVLVEFA